MARKNKTNKNLQEVWDKLDKACGNIESAMDILNSMSNLSNEVLNLMERIDFSLIVGLKNEVKELMNENN